MRHRPRPCTPFLLSAALPLLLLAQAAAAFADADLRDRALEAYDAGSCETALPLLAELDAAGEADGPLLYRFYYCQRATGNPGAGDTLKRARTALEQELPSTKALEVPFYLANVYQNIAKLTDARRLSEETVAKLESGSWPEPTDAAGMFQLGKLYENLEREAEARTWYAKSVAAMPDDAGGLSLYGQWAARYIAERAYDGGDFAAAAEQYARITADRPTLEDLNRLAIACVRTGDFKGADGAWRAAVRLDPAQGNNARYSSNLAQRATETGGLDPAAPDGRAWAELTPQDLETAMLEQANVVREVRGEEHAGELTAERRQELREKLAGAKRVFVSAAMEYAVRGLPIRETAFTAGYATLIFRQREWVLE
jgi:tetratricopeptide (TPR) repeat protein